jgi:hypothetical protein
MDRRSPGAGTVILHLDPVKDRHPSDVILRELTEWAAFFLFARMTILDPIPCSTYLFSPVSSTCLAIFANQPAFYVFMQYFYNFFSVFFATSRLVAIERNYALINPSHPVYTKVVEVLCPWH